MVTGECDHGDLLEDTTLQNFSNEEPAFEVFQKNCERPLVPEV